MRTTWILVGDASRARIFEIPGPGRPMRELRDFFNPEGREKNRDVDSGAHGRPSPAEHDEEMFAIELTDGLHNARAQGRFETLHLIAPPKLLGMLRRHLDAPTRKRVGKEIDKDLSRASIQDIEHYVRGNPDFEMQEGRVTNVPKR